MTAPAWTRWFKPSVLRPYKVRDKETLAIRELIREVGDDDGLVPVLLPVGDGLLLAKKEWAPESD